MTFKEREKMFSFWLKLDVQNLGHEVSLTRQVTSQTTALVITEMNVIMA